MMENCHGLYLLLATGILQLALAVEGAPLPSDTGFAGEEKLPLFGLLLAVSVASLFTLLLVLLNCASCCKEQDINFEEFDDNFPDEVDFTPPAEDTPSLQPNTEVYTLAVPPLALPGPPHLDPPANPGVKEVSTVPQVTRQSLSYIQEIGTGWFGKVLLSEKFSEQELGASRVLVQELKASADPPEQKRFLLLAEPYRVLQHPNIVHCLGQCVDSIPFLLVFEHCELGDLKGCLKQPDWKLHNIELLQLQKMACEIAAGITHLHKHNFLHSDLALRNCFLTSDLTVKVGDYGTGPSRYKDDYVAVATEPMVPLRWTAPELISEIHSDMAGVAVEEQTKPGNVWALGVTLWELLESAAQPYSQLSDQEVLSHVIKEQLVRLSKPQLDLPYSDRWYEALQFCWLPHDKRATAEEVHRLLTYLRMQGQRQVEEDFQQRWDALRPRPAQGHASFPILDRFGEPDELLTVTETSHGLSFEYVWEAARHDPTALSHHSVFFPAAHYEAQSPAEAAHGVLPVFDTHKVGSGKEYYIQLEEQEPRAGERNPQSNLPGGGPQQENVILQDSGLDESSTDPDFFHHSLDSRDSNPASQPESPYRAHVFSDRASSAPDHPWASGLLELPEFSTNSLQRGAPPTVGGMGNSSSFGAIMDLRLLDEAEGRDTVGGHLLDLPNLSDDFLFPKAENLAREGGNWGQREDAPVADSDCVPDPDLRVISMEYSEVATSDEVESGSDPALSRVEGPPNILVPLPLPLMKTETLVPSGMPEAGGENPSDSFLNRASSPDKECSLLNSSETRTDLVLNLTSEHTEVTARPVNSHLPPLLGLSANTDTLFNAAKNLCLPESQNEWPVLTECPAEQCSLSPASTCASETTSDFDCVLLGETYSDHSLTEGTTLECNPVNKRVADQIGSVLDTASDRGLTDGTLSDSTELQDRTGPDCGLMDEAISDHILTDKSVLMNETASNQMGLREESALDHSPLDRTVSDQSLKDETDLDGRSVRDDGTSVCSLSKGPHCIDFVGHSATDTKLQEVTDGEHLACLPEDPSIFYRGPQALIPGRLLELTDEEAVLEQTGHEALLELTGTGVLLEQTGTGVFLEQTGTEALLEQTGTMVLLEQTGTEALLEQTGKEALLEQTGTEALLEQTGTEALLEQTGMEALLEQTGTEALLEQTGTEALLEQTGTEALLEQTGTEALLEQTGTEALLEQTGTEALLEQTGTEALLEQTGTEALLEQTGTEALLEQTGTEALLEQTGTEALLEQTGTEALLEQTGTEALLEQTGTEVLLEQAGKETLLHDSGLASMRQVEGLPETPKSTESLNVHHLQPPCRITDSGYDTENLESPEWSSQAVDQRVAGPKGVEPSPVTPEVITLDTESTSDEGEGISASSPSPLPPVEELLALRNQSYRDSAYFSDNESEPEKRLEESGPTACTPWQMGNLGASGVTSDILAPSKIGEGNKGLPESQGKVLQEAENLCNCKNVPELMLTPAENWAQGVMGSIDGSEETGEQPKLVSREEPNPARCTRPPSPPPPEVHDGVFHAKLVRTNTGFGAGPKLREQDAEGRYLVAGSDGAEDGSEADEEDENSDDSDDEDMQAYRLHSSTSDSDDEPPPPAPIIVMDTSHAHSLRSLLKAGASSSAVADAPSLPGKKAVSFFDDVTLYLFDQETPTKDLGDHLSGSCNQEFHSPAPSSSNLNRLTNSESSTDEEGGTFEWDDDFSPSESSFISKATGDLDKPKTPPAMASQYFSPPPAGHAADQNWPRPSSTFSRFSISPASIANFSLTHLTDSDMEQGSSEEGEKE